MSWEGNIHPHINDESFNSLHQSVCPCIDIVNPLSPNSDQHQISPSNVNAHSTPEVKRIKDMITQGEFLDILITSPQYFYKRSMGTR